MKVLTNTRMRRAGLWLLCLLLTLSLAVPGTAYAAPAQTDPLTAAEIAFLEAIDYDYVYGHVKYISNEIGVGYAGTPAELRRAEYLAGELAKLGYEAWDYATSPDGVDDYFQTIENDSSIVSRIGGSFTINGHEYPANAPTWSSASVYKGYERPAVTGETVYFPSAAEAVAADADLITGKIVLTHRNPEETSRTLLYAADARALEAKGALAVVFFYNKYTVNANGKTSGESAFATPTTGDEIHIPVLLTSYFDGQSILASLTHHDAVHSATATAVNRRSTTTQNVLAIKEAAAPSDKFVLIGAHLDSVFGVLGANDNQSGVTSILGIAQAIKDIPTKYNIIFAFWGAEEAGLRGSRYFYSNTLAPNDYYKNFIAYFNLDMTATSQKNNTQLTIHTPYRDTANGNTPIISAAGELFEKHADRYWAYADGKWGDWWKTEADTGLVVKREYYGNCSDHASITGANAGVPANEGIPQVYVFWRTDDSGVVEYNNHVVGDRYDWPGDSFSVKGEPFTGNYSIERAEILTNVFALSLYESAGVLETAGVRADAYSHVGESVAFTVSLKNASRVTTVALDFTLDTANLTADTTELAAADDFTILPARTGTDPVEWTHLGGTLWQGRATLVYLGANGFSAGGDGKDILTITRQASRLGDVSLTLNRVTVTEAGNYTSLIETALSPAKAVVSVAKVYAVWDLNRDERIDQLDLSFVQAFYQAAATDANWDVVNVYGYKPRQADINGDGAVNLIDLIAVYAHYTVS